MSAAFRLPLFVDSLFCSKQVFVVVGGGGGHVSGSAATASRAQRAVSELTRRERVVTACVWQCPERVLSWICERSQRRVQLCAVEFTSLVRFLPQLWRIRPFDPSRFRRDSRDYLENVIQTFDRNAWTERGQTRSKETAREHIRPAGCIQTHCLRWSGSLVAAAASLLFHDRFWFIWRC